MEKDSLKMTSQELNDYNQRKGYYYAYSLYVRRKEDGYLYNIDGECTEEIYRQERIDRIKETHDIAAQRTYMSFRDKEAEKQFNENK